MDIEKNQDAEHGEEIDPHNMVYQLRVRISEEEIDFMIHRPWATNHSPALILATRPTTVIKSRFPWTLTRRTANPVSSLWKVTLSTKPLRPSSGAFGLVFSTVI